MSEALKTYLAAAARRPRGWGSFDCCLFMADWIVERRGVDPAGALRNAYSSPREALRIIRAAGGLWPLAASLARSAGLSPRIHAEPGDVGIVLAGKRQYGAIRTGKGWAVLTASGIAVQRLPALGAWEV